MQHSVEILLVAAATRHDNRNRSLVCIHAKAQCMGQQWRGGGNEGVKRAWRCRQAAASRCWTLGAAEDEDNITSGAEMSFAKYFFSRLFVVELQRLQFKLSLRVFIVQKSVLSHHVGAHS